MRATETLRSEHRIIEAMLDQLEEITNALETGSPTSIGYLHEMVNFFQSFADGVHHGKEEALLFPQLEARGAHPERGPTACMRREHEEGRARLDGMDEAVGRMEVDLSGGIQAFALHARPYLANLRAHIRKEDHCLFSMADQILTEADQMFLEAQFSMVDGSGHGLEMRRYWIRYARELCRRKGVVLPERTTPSADALAGA